ncbi:MAG: hypothetical protein IJY44_06775 [Bacteroidaceae bacterium]|nr:hypothetical protein [Bacteroidaceae bacterium]
MKKNYTAPLMTEVNVEAENMLAASLRINTDADAVNSSQMLDGGHRGSWGDLWK